MSAEAFVSFAQAAGLSVVSQEIISWGKTEGIDAISIVVRERSPFKRENVAWRNPLYMQEADYIRQLGQIYSGSPHQPGQST